MLSTCVFRNYDARCRSDIYEDRGAEVLDYAIGYVAGVLVFALLKDHEETDEKFYGRVQAKMATALQNRLHELFSVFRLRDHQVRYPSGKIYLFDNSKLVARAKRIIDLEAEANPNLIRQLLSEAYQYDVPGVTEPQMLAAIKLAAYYAPVPGVGFPNAVAATRFAQYNAHSQALAQKRGLA